MYYRVSICRTISTSSVVNGKIIVGGRLIRLIFTSVNVKNKKRSLSEGIGFRESMTSFDRGNRASARLGSMLWMRDSKMRFRFKVTAARLHGWDLRRRLRNGCTSSLSAFCILFFCSLILMTVTAILWQCVASWPLNSCNVSMHLA